MERQAPPPSSDIPAGRFLTLWRRATALVPVAALMVAPTLATPVLAAAFFLALAGEGGAPARAADPLPYTVGFARTGNAALDGAISGSSQLQSLRTNAPVGPFALVARAQADVGRLTTALESFGYYGATLAIRIDGLAADDPALPERLAALPAGRSVAVTVGVATGPLFHLGAVMLKGEVPPRARDALKLKPGDPAVASDVLAARDRVLTALQEDGHALAKVDAPVAFLHPDARTLSVDYAVDEGPRVDIGPIALDGLGGVNERFVRRRLLVHPGELYLPSKIEAARTDLAATGVFSGVQVRAAPKLDPAGRLPLTFDLQERRRHAVGLEVGYSTDLGIEVTASWSDRNLFGNAEQLNLSATATGGGSAVKGLAYDARAQFLKPDFGRRDQVGELDLEALKQNLLSYNQVAIIAAGTVRRKFSTVWSGSVGLKGEQEQIQQEGVTTNYTLVGVPVSAQFDMTGLADPLLDPTRGVRGALTATPTVSLAGTQQFFAILQASGSTYLDFATLGLTKPGRSVVALRALVGSIQGATSQFSLPPDQRFYGGGSATVRGYQFQGVSPYFPRTTVPTGGAGIDAGTVELRQRIVGNIGAVGFLDAGQVNATPAPFGGTLRVGAGVGARYYTAIGPIRLDVAVPLNKPPGGDTFELYIGLGQAF
jgi:translocation and assembly module TamA